MSEPTRSLSPSSATRWLNCVGSAALSATCEKTTSAYADEGIKAHDYAAWALNAKDTPGNAWPVDDEMAEYVHVYTDAITRAAEGKSLFVEMEVSIEKWTSKKGSRPYRADAVIVGVGTLEVHDLKYGMGHLVYAEHNEQLMLYALGVLDVVAPFADVQEVKLVIHQPRRDHISEWTVNVDNLLGFGETVKKLAAEALACKPGERLTPSAEACLFCPAKTICPALRSVVMDNVMRDFDPITEKVVVEQMPASVDTYPTPDVLNMVELWHKAQSTAIFEQLQSFKHVPGWKLVLGREGNRKFNDETAVEELLKTLRIPKGESHEQKLKSPAKLEKLGLSPKKWAQIEARITRGDAKPTMVDARDPRPAVEPAKVDEFPTYDPTNDDNNLTDLFR